MEQEFNMTSKQIISDELMASMRLLVMTEQELNDYDISNLSKLLTTMVSIENERNVLSELENLFEEMKTVAYTTSLDDNVKRLNDEDTRLCDEERYSLIYLIGQKSIIHKVLMSIQQRRSLLDQNQEQV
ncbi:unnamed protein product [Didymodactylos carnosus]|uniref:Rubisco LSMT substrate-binding domain-containing protein n=1 Tax=Didymodactylos carnosus TaxID=1234261 RepID=A0A816BPV2_9BILA|nr:unnamed protein product [Didymodactylos carnosus]CAF4493229.1 unnamed protein product [Didymodactylos carnosus]